MHRGGGIIAFPWDRALNETLSAYRCGHASLAVIAETVVRQFLFPIALAGAILTSSAALAETIASTGPNPDPWEHTNRQLYRIDRGLDRAIIRPTTVFYHHALAHPIREGVHNVLYNLGEPVTFLNNVLQVRPDKAANTVVRFATNSTVGVLGIFDVTGGAGMERVPSGFSETLTRYGAAQGPYLYIPVFGPSSVRDLTGRVVDIVTDPFNFLSYDGRDAVTTSRTVLGGIDRRDALDPAIREVQRTATDPYATTRSAFLQTTSATGQSETDVKALPDFGPEPGSSSEKPIPPPPAQAPPPKD